MVLLCICFGLKFTDILFPDYTLKHLTVNISICCIVQKLETIKYELKRMIKLFKLLDRMHFYLLLQNNAFSFTSYENIYHSSTTGYLLWHKGIDYISMHLNYNLKQ